MKLRHDPLHERRAPWRKGPGNTNGAHPPCPICGEQWSTCSHMLACGPGYRGAVVCAGCGGDGEVARVERGRHLHPVGCPRCGGTGVDPLRVAQ